MNTCASTAKSFARSSGLGGQDGLKGSGPAHVKEARDDGSYICGATIVRADGGELLRRAVFEISEDGCVEVIE